jgi:hypothetical protein
MYCIRFRNEINNSLEKTVGVARIIKVLSILFQQILNIFLKRVSFNFGFKAAISLFRFCFLNEKT